MPLPQIRPETQEELTALRVPVDMYDGVQIYTFPISDSRCQLLRSSIHPEKPGCLMRLQCTEPRGHVGRAHFYHAPTNTK